MNHPSHNPILILIRGLPGSGKSYLAAALRNSFGGGNTVMLDPDATNYDSLEYKQMAAELTEQGVDAKFYPYRFLRAQAHRGIEQNKIIIWNQAFTQFDGFNKTVINLRAHADEHHKQLPILVVEVQIDPELAKQRVAQRASQGGHYVNAEAFARFINDYASFASQGFTTVSINGDADVAASVTSVRQALDALLQ